MGGSGLKRLRMLLEDSSDDEDSFAEQIPGCHQRRGAWKPANFRHPEKTGLDKMRQEWQKGKLWLLLQDTSTADHASASGERFRSLLGMPRGMFDEWLQEATTCPEIADHTALDGQRKKGPPTIPLKLKLGGGLRVDALARHHEVGG